MRLLTKEAGCFLMLWLVVGNLFLILDCPAQPIFKGRNLVLRSLMYHALLIPIGGLPLSEHKQSINRLRCYMAGRGGGKIRGQEEEKLWMGYKIHGPVT